MRSQRGVTLFELVVVLAIASVAVAVTVAYSTPWLGRESMHGAVSDTYSFFQLTRMESVKRNQACRLVVDTVDGELGVWDSAGTVSTSDDVLLHKTRLPDSVSFARPDVGTAVTLEATAETGVYQTVFSSDGMVASGAGSVYLHGGNGFRAVSVYAAGASAVAKWNGAAWVEGN
jgi:prepilin-type N-terminal cleavage/methylation domain-containing protein